jgi:hypothetical protein
MRLTSCNICHMKWNTRGAWARFRIALSSAVPPLAPRTRGHAIPQRPVRCRSAASNSGQAPQVPELQTAVPRVNNQAGLIPDGSKPVSVTISRRLTLESGRTPVEEGLGPLYFSDMNPRDAPA